MFDFYGLYALWFELGGGREAYKLAVEHPQPHSRRKLIDTAFTDCTWALAKALPQAMFDAIKVELEHVEDETLIPTESYRRWAESRGDAKLLRLVQFGQVTLPDDPLGALGWERVRAILAAPFWQEHADLYCGPAWAAILTKAVELLDAYKRDLALLVLVKKIDEIYDLEHNTGSLGTKLGNLAISKADLDVRAGLTSVQAFQQLVSPSVKRLIMAAKGQLGKSHGAVIRAQPKPELWTIIRMDNPLQDLAVKEAGATHDHDAILALKSDVQSYEHWTGPPEDFKFSAQPLTRPSDPRKRLFVGTTAGGKLVINGKTYDKALFNVELYETANPRDL